MGIEDADDLTEQIEHQITAGIDQADVLLFVVDAHTGIVPLDREVNKRLRQINKPILCVVNKTDGPKWDPQADEFYQLGRRSLLPVSTKANRNKEELLAAIVECLPESSEDESRDDPEMRLAIVGRRNVGKSTFVNSLVNAERMIVSEVPGTTRDSVDVRFELDGKSFTAIDTPGNEKAGQRED